MTLKKFSLDKLPEIIERLKAGQEVFAPVRGKEGVNFQLITDPNQVTLNFDNTLLSAKSVFFPPEETLIRFRMGKSSTEVEPVEKNIPERLLFGVRPCDLRSFEILDKVFGEGEFRDPLYLDRRDKTTIVAYACNQALPTCFCTSLGGSPTDSRGSDAILYRLDSSVIIKSITAKGDELLRLISPVVEDAAADDEASIAQLEKKAGESVTRSIDISGAAEKLPQIFESGYWKQAAYPCLNCGACTYVCPTCTCFDIQDESLHGEGSRKKIWDSCMFTDFTLMAGGVNPRTRKEQRLRQRVNDKFSYRVTNLGITACVGCGRCIRVCPVNIDITALVKGALEVTV
jgi:sulfhydrogenase subunit beta (sulfur reductase)